MKKVLLTFMILSGWHNLSVGQTIPAGTAVFEDYYRRMQLIGNSDLDQSFTIRPINLTGHADVFGPDSEAYVYKGPKFLRLLPFSIQQQYNSDHPYGWNDGSMIPAKGYQTMISGGFFVKLGPLSIQLRPEYVYAENLRFDGFATPSRTDESYYAYYIYHNQTDAPERLGDKPYKKLFWGQSSIRLNLGGVSFGLSNENIWWGPGIYNTLILSNNAPGFKHVTINTLHPLNTFLGSFEGQVLAGRLEGSGISPLLTVKALSDGQPLYNPKRDDWRYFTGFNVNYHPKWLKGLTLGITRTFDAYHADVKRIADYFPFFIPYQKINTNDGDPIPRDQYTSLYSRWIFREANAEIYFEYGLNDNSYNYRDFIGSPEHSRAYVFGIRKMLPLNNSRGNFILFDAEITQLSQTPDRIVRDAQGWYIHGAVRDGQTNQGQVLGAGTGSGGNLQTSALSWCSGLKKIGVAVERYEHDVDFYINAFKDINGNSRKWVDFAFALNWELNYKNLIFNGKLQGIKSYNYEWILKDYDPDLYYIPHNDRYNFHGEFGITYRF